MIIVDSEKNYKKQSANTLIAVVKGVVFNDEIEEVGSLLGDRWVDILAVKSLRNGTQASFEGTAAGLTKKCVALDITLKLCYNIYALRRSEGFGGLLPLREGDMAFVKFL